MRSGYDRDEVPTLAPGQKRTPAPKVEEFVWPPADDFTAMPALAAQAAVAASAAPGHRRRKRSDRRKAVRRRQNVGSPHGSECRAGTDDRRGGRRNSPDDQAGLGLTRDHVPQTEARVTTDDTGLDDGDLVGFGD